MFWEWAKQPADFGPHKKQEYHQQILYIMGALAIQYAITYVFCAMCDKAFKKMDRRKRAEYVGRSTAIIHAIVVSITSLIGTFYLW